MGADGEIDAHLDISTSGYSGRLEVCKARPGAVTEKALIVAESLIRGPMKRSPHVTATATP